VCSKRGVTLSINLRVALYVCAVVMANIQAIPLQAAEAAVTQEQLLLLQQQNQALQDQLRQQQKLIDSLSQKVNQIQDESKASTDQTQETRTDLTSGLNKISISGEGAAGFLKSEREGLFPKGDFRLDEARLFLEAPVHEGIYFFSEIDLQTREAEGWSLQLGETYLDFEGVSRLWDNENMLNVRLGRMFIPFGEEYLERFAMDNPLISHSLSDLWGVDQGIELYGAIGPVRYAAAVQNGGEALRDFSEDKSVSGRLSYDPARWLHLSVSGMRTGDLLLADGVSAMWFGGGWFIPFGSTNVTRFHADLLEGDIKVTLPHGQLKAFGGYVRYDDNDRPQQNGRDIYYYSVEAQHDLIAKLYGAARFSQIFARNGFPIGGNASMAPYAFIPNTEEIWRLSLGLGYRLNHNLILKAEYSFEQAKEIGGEKRDHEDLFGVEAAFKF
jgi:hypothetical protein